jgi:hypothetical protein
VRTCLFSERAVFHTWRIEVLTWSRWFSYLTLLFFCMWVVDATSYMRLSSHRVNAELTLSRTGVCVLPSFGPCRQVYPCSRESNNRLRLLKMLILLDLRRLLRNCRFTESFSTFPPLSHWSTLRGHIMLSHQDSLQRARRAFKMRYRVVRTLKISLAQLLDRNFRGALLPDPERIQICITLLKTSRHYHLYCVDLFPGHHIRMWSRI